MIKTLLYSVLILASISPLLSDDSGEDTDNVTFYRLPEILTPTLYDLSFTIDPSQNNYTGTVNITFDVSEEENATDYIYLHADTEFITIDSVILNDDIDCVVGVPYEVSILSVKCSQEATGTNNILSIKYEAKFSTEDEYGMVKSSYTDKGENQLLIESNFKPIYARRAFPCMDEPEFTANFSIEVTYPAEYTIISNSPILESGEESDNMKTTKFVVTPKISTYLVSILLSKLQAANNESEEGIDFKIFARADVVDLTNTVAANYYNKIIDELSNYTGISYQSLYDIESYQIAVPEYLDSTGGFGVFTYRETQLLDEGDKTSQRVTQDIITAMAYKLTHEWYGGDIATEWWSDAWANEAVAMYLGYIIADKVNEELDLLDQFVIEVVQKSLQYDGMPFVQPLSSNESVVQLTDDITDKLDALSFQKGASFLRMMRYILGGDDQFQTAIANHWQQRKDSSTNGSDLLFDLTETHANWYEFLETWIFSPGYPLLTVKIVNVTGDGVEVTRLFQKRFVYPTETKYDTNTEWVIPLNTITQYNRDFTVTIEGFYEPQDENYYFYGRGDWLLFNLEMGLLYRVNYDEILWRRFISSLKSETERTWIPLLNRVQMLDDIFNVARIGDVSYSVAFELADFLVQETEYYPWYTALNAFSYFMGKLEDDQAEENLKSYILNLMRNIITVPDSKGIASDETHIDVLKKVMILKWACDLNHADCVDYFTKEFRNYVETDSESNDYNLRGVTFCTGIRYSENVTADWQFLWNVYTTSASVHEQDDILNALGCAEDEDVLYAYLLKIISSDSGIKRQDAVAVFNSVFSSSAGLSAATRFFNENFDDIFSLEVNIWSQMLYNLAEKLFSDEHLDWLRGVLANETLDAYESIKTKADVLTSVNNYWANNYQVYVKEVLLTPTTSTSTTPTTTTITTSTITTAAVSSDTTLTATTDVETTSEFTTTSSVTTNSTTPSTSTTPGHGEKIAPSLSFICFILVILILG